VLAAHLRLVRAGFDRYAVYRTASLAALGTNSVFGLLRASVLLAVIGAAGPVAGYDAATVVTYVWLGQGLIGLVDLWGVGELAERVRTGEIAVDLSRPWDLQAAMLSLDMGRAGFALLVRFVPPVVLGALFFPFRMPVHVHTWPAFAASLLLAVVVCQQFRFLLELTAFWLLDVRGVRAVWLTTSGLLCGLVVPLAFLPAGVRAVLAASPFPAMIQTPIDVFTERGPAGALLAGQLLWAVLLVAVGRLVLRRATRKLVLQGG
jgi:ABC-2 type transport system permease protein